MTLRLEAREWKLTPWQARINALRLIQAAIEPYEFAALHKAKQIVRERTDLNISVEMTGHGKYPFFDVSLWLNAVDPDGKVEPRWDMVRLPLDADLALNLPLFMQLKKALSLYLKENEKTDAIHGLYTAGIEREVDKAVNSCTFAKGELRPYTANLAERLRQYALIVEAYGIDGVADVQSV